MSDTRLHRADQPSSAASSMSAESAPAGSARFPIVAREGWPIIAWFVIASVVLGAAGWWIAAPLGIAVGAAGAVLSGWAVWFFRDPERRTPRGEGLVIAPADGVVVSIGPCPPPEELGFESAAAGAMTRISIFMNVFNVHVNRSPVACTVTKLHYRPGKFFNASLDKASEHNERCSLRLRMGDGRELACVQIAGLVARRIVWRIGEGDGLDAGERYGLIRFGSRVDVYLPPGAAPAVSLRQRTVAGETVIATLGPARGGVGGGGGGGGGGARAAAVAAQEG